PGDRRTAGRPHPGSTGGRAARGRPCGRPRRAGNRWATLPTSGWAPPCGGCSWGTGHEHRKHDSGGRGSCRQTGERRRNVRSPAGQPEGLLGDGATVTDQATLVADAPPAEEVSRRRPGVVDRWSVWVFAAAVVAALPLLLWFGRDHWFYLDEWQILGADGVTRTGYLDGHNGHWITLLRLEYRLTFELWGLRSYVPYQVPAILGHLASAVLVRQICRRVGARDWIATAAALAFLFFGSGRENMTLGFQGSLTGSLICGFGMLLLAEGPKTVTRRDWLALGLGVVGLMTSSVFVAVLVGFGITTLLRRGVRLAAFYTVPLGAIYMAWYAAYGDESGLPVKLTDETARYFRRVLWAVLDALARGGVGAVLLALMVVGLAGALLRARRFHRWADAALPVGLCAAW